MRLVRLADELNGTQSEYRQQREFEGKVLHLPQWMLQEQDSYATVKDGRTPETKIGSRQ
jgi:hypothetical protein